MIRYAFTMKLRPGALAEYRRLHDELWPELFAEIERSGVATMTIFESDPDLFLFSEVKDEETWQRLRDSEVHQRWTDTLRPLFVLKEDGTPDLGDLREVFHIETSAARTPARERRQRLLYLHAREPSVTAQVIGWARHPGDNTDGVTGERPYASVAAAIEDGWQAIQFPQRPGPVDDRETDVLGFEFVLQKLEPANG